MSFIIPLTILCIVGLSLFYWKRLKSQDWVTPKEAFPEGWRMILTNHIAYYNALSGEEKKKIRIQNPRVHTQL